MKRLLLLFAIVLFSTNLTQAQVPSSPLSSSADRTYRPEGYFPGINLAGAEFGKGPGVLGKDYLYPTEAECSYFQSKGFKIVRIPFKWERLQPLLLGDLDPENLLELDRCVRQANAHGLVVLLDVHNYGMRLVGDKNFLLGVSPELTGAHFNDFWVKLATHYKDNPQVWLGLMNEPYKQTAAQTAEIMQAAVKALRTAGIKNKILVPGTSWTGAHSWVRKGNAAAYENFVDPGDNFAFEVHQYLDKNFGGPDPHVVAGAGATRLVVFTEWARQHHFKAFLGEFSWDRDPANEQAPIEGEALLGYMDANKDVWIGYTFWAAGPLWNKYTFSIEPTGLREGKPVDSSQMAIVRKHLQ